MAKKKEESGYSVILDTSFMIRLLSESEELHSSALRYFKYFIDEEVPMYFSTVSIAEYCVKGDFDDLPFQNIRVLPFNIFHAKEAGKFAKALFEARRRGIIDISDRLIIPNDSKIFAQGAYEDDIRYFVTADSKSKKNIEVIKTDCNAKIEHLDIHKPCNETFGMLNLD